MRRTSLLSSPRRDSTKELSDAASLSSLDPGEMKDLQYIDPSKEHKLTIEVSHRLILHAHTVQQRLPAI